MGAARNLGLKHTTLIGKMRRMGILRSTEATLSPVPRISRRKDMIIHVGQGCEIAPAQKLVQFSARDQNVAVVFKSKSLTLRTPKGRKIKARFVDQKRC
jgi:hypothetical protein